MWQRRSPPFKRCSTILKLSQLCCKLRLRRCVGCARCLDECATLLISIDFIPTCFHNSTAMEPQLLCANAKPMEDRNAKDLSVLTKEAGTLLESLFLGTYDHYRALCLSVDPPSALVESFVEFCLMRDPASTALEQARSRLMNFLGGNDPCDDVLRNLRTIDADREVALLQETNAAIDLRKTIQRNLRERKLCGSCSVYSKFFQTLDLITPEEAEKLEKC